MPATLPPPPDRPRPDIGETAVCPCCRRTYSVLEIFTLGLCGWCTAIKCQPRNPLSS